DISFVPYFPLASGLLAGKYDESTSFAEGDIRLKQADFQGESFKKVLQKVDQLRDIAVEKEVEVAQLVLATYLHHKAIDVIIPGAKKVEQIGHNAGAANIKLSEEEVNEIYNIFS